MGPRPALFSILLVGLMGCVHKPTTPPSSEISAPTPGTQGIETLKAAIKNSPRRLDLRFRLSAIYGSQGDFESQYDLWVETFQMKERMKDSFLWENNGPLPQKASPLIPARLQETIDRYLGLGTHEGTARALRLAKLGLTYCPNRASFERSRAICYSRRGDPKAAMKCLLRLLKRDPNSPATLLDIGVTLRNAGKPREARLYFQKVKKLGIPGEALNQAEQELREN